MEIEVEAADEDGLINGVFEVAVVAIDIRRGLKEDVLGFGEEDFDSGQPMIGAFIPGIDGDQVMVAFSGDAVRDRVAVDFPAGFPFEDFREVGGGVRMGLLHRLLWFRRGCLR